MVNVVQPDIGNVLQILKNGWKKFTAFIGIAAAMCNVGSCVKANFLQRKAEPEIVKIVKGEMPYVIFMDEKINPQILLPWHKKRLVQNINSEVIHQNQIRFPSSLSSNYYPSGWMGDAAVDSTSLSITQVVDRTNSTALASYRIMFNTGSKGWAGIYWLYPGSNWGDQLGRCLLGATKITLLARGQTGNEIVDFQSGLETHPGKKYSDLYHVSTGLKVLPTTWAKYELDISQENLEDVIGAFACIVPKQEGGPMVTFYLAEIKIE